VIRSPGWHRKTSQILDRVREADGLGPPVLIGVLTPAAARAQRPALRWLARRPAQRVPWLPVSVRCSAAAVAVLGVVAAAAVISHGTPVGVAVLLVQLLVEHLPDRLDARAGAHVRTVEAKLPGRRSRTDTAAITLAGAVLKPPGPRRTLLCQTQRHAEEPWPPHVGRRQKVSPPFARPPAAVGLCAAGGWNAAA
jgi:hypothetical protein